MPQLHKHFNVSSNQHFITMFNLFFRSKVKCPRCLGKGNVDADDIKRLGQELRWAPGLCAYCNGKGKISSKLVSKVKADNSYLTIDIGGKERELLFKADKEALQRAKQHDYQLDIFIAQIKYLHFIGNMDAETIAHFFFIEKTGEEISYEERYELIEYIEHIISDKKN